MHEAWLRDLGASSGTSDLVIRLENLNRITFSGDVRGGGKTVGSSAYDDGIMFESR
jgi:hypothetical protein